MKKTIIIALVLALCLPVVSHAIDESVFVGTWINETFNEETGSYSLELLRLTADHQAYFCVQSFTPGEVGFGRESAKTWSVKGNGIHIVLGEYAETDAVILDDGRLGFKLVGNAYVPYTRIIPQTKPNEPEPTNTPAPNIPDGIRIPQGEFTIGEFIKPGTYRVTLVGDDLAVIWVTKPKQITGTYYSLSSFKGETEAIVQLQEGYTFRVQHSSVILSEMTGF